jgi:Xaa-Pro aminopeptidase
MSIVAERITATRRYLAERGLDALIAFNNGQNLFLDSHAVFVLSGVRPLGESVLVLEREGPVTLVAVPAWDRDRLAHSSKVDKTIALDDLPAGVSRLLEGTRLDAAKVVTTGLATMPGAFVHWFRETLGDNFQVDDRYVAKLARVRSPEELRAAEKATAIAEKGYEHLLKTARVGLREYELVAELHCHMKELGAEDNFLLVSASQHNLGVCAAGRRALDIGDIILSEITPCYQGQYAQLCRTTVIGEPSSALHEKYAVLQAAMRRGQAAARPGRKVREVTAEIDDCFRAAGYGEYCRPPYMRVRGHGLGITSDQPGDITADSDVVLEAGMVFVMHPNQYLPETGYLMCGEPVVITEAGARALSQRMAQLDPIAI